MKKLLCIVLSAIMLVSMCSITAVSTSAAEIATSTTEVYVEKGDYISYTFNMNVGATRVISYQGETAYTPNLELVLPRDKYGDLEKTKLFPVFGGPTVSNFDLENNIKYNYSIGQGGVRFDNDNCAVISLIFKANATGTASVTTKVDYVKNSDLVDIIHAGIIKESSLYNFSSSVDMVMPENVDYALNAPSIKVSNSTSSVSISWSKQTGASKYRLFVKESGLAPWKSLATTSSTSYSHTAVKSGTKYTYTLRCLDSNDNYISGFDASGTSILYVAAPKISSVSNTTSGVKVTWGKVTGASKYQVYVKKSGAKSWTSKGVTSSTSYTHTSAKSGTTYVYTIRATDSKGNNISSYYSSGKSIKYVAAPKIKSASNTTKGVKITWSKVSGASKYRVYVKKSGAKSWTSKGVTSSTSYTHTSAKSGTTYVYTIRATDSKGNNISSYYSSGKSIKYVAAPKIKSIKNSSKGVKITWSKVSGASKYRVYVKKSGAKSWTSKGVTSSTSYTHTSAKSGTTYIYTIRATDSKGNSLSAYNSSGWKIKCKK